MLELGQGPGMPVAQLRGDQGVPAKPGLRQAHERTLVRQIAGHHGQLDRSHRAPRNAAQPFRRHGRGRQQGRRLRAKPGRIGQGLHDHVAGELGVAFPLDGVVVKSQPQEVAVQLLRRQGLLPRQPAQMLALHLAGDTFVEHSHMDDQRRHPDARRRPRVHFVVQGGAQRIVGRQHGHRGRNRGFSRTVQACVEVHGSILPRVASRSGAGNQGTQPPEMTPLFIANIGHATLG